MFINTIYFCGLREFIIYIYDAFHSFTSNNCHDSMTLKVKVKQTAQSSMTPSSYYLNAIYDCLPYLHTTLRSFIHLCLFLHVCIQWTAYIWHKFFFFNIWHILCRYSIKNFFGAMLYGIFVASCPKCFKENYGIPC